MSTLLRDLSPSPPRPDYWETPREMEVEELDARTSWFDSAMTAGVFGFLVVLANVIWGWWQ